jgi:hypothetical protein
VWKHDRNTKTNIQTKTRKGMMAGSILYQLKGQPSRWTITINGKSYASHRIIYILVYGYLSEDSVVDHIDGNPLNNRIGNLRAVTKRTNAQNQRMRRDNKSGVVGVCKLTTTDIRGNILHFWTAFWKDINTRSQSKSFSIKKLGDEEAFKLAVDYRRSVIESLQQEGMCYTGRHGVKDAIKRGSNVTN